MGGPRVCQNRLTSFNDGTRNGKSFYVGSDQGKGGFGAIELSLLSVPIGVAPLIDPFDGASAITTARQSNAEHHSDWSETLLITSP
jgi:hypothetical protein